MKLGSELALDESMPVALTVKRKPNPLLNRDDMIDGCGSHLAQSGELADAKTEEDWLARVNGHFLFKQHVFFSHKLPKTLSEAIDSDGVIQKDAEVYVFGKWLLLDGSPGLSNHPGKKAVSRSVVETLCSAVLVTDGLGGGMVKNGLWAEARPKKPTTTNLAKAAERIFGVKTKASDFSGRKIALQRILEAYLNHLKTGTYDVTGTGKVATKSLRLAKVLKALTAKPKGSAATTMSGAASPAKTKVSPLALSAASPAPAVSTAPVIPPARTIRHSVKTMPPMQIPLIYAHPKRKVEYRTATRAMLPDTLLDYTWHNPEAHSSATTLRAYRSKTLLLKPDLDVAANFNVKAVIDRMAITLSVTQPTNWIFLHRLLRAAKLRGWVEDRVVNARSGKKEDSYHLEAIALSEPIGKHFAILIQEPTPERVEAFLRRIDLKRVIDGAVVLILLETSIDFFVKDTSKPDEMIRLREQIVGIIHRHFYCAPMHFKDSSDAFDARNDERQVYAEGDVKKTKTNFLIADKKVAVRKSSYEWRADADVRKKILAKPKKGIYLNSAVYHGSRELGFQISLQHKFSDERDIVLGTHKLLPDEKRRARVELELHGVSRLKEQGICTVNDLSKTNFRSVISKFCSFKLPVMHKSGTVLQEYIDVFGLRGCCSTSLYEAVKDFDDREKKLKASKTVLRKTENQTPGLEPWREMNILTGRALDQLSRTWKKFSWP